MSIMRCNVTDGVAELEGMLAYRPDTIRMSVAGLAIDRMQDTHGVSVIATTGPHFSFPVVSSLLLRGWLFAHLEYGAPSQCEYTFAGPTLGLVRAYAGYDAAASGGDGRPIETLHLRLALNAVGLDFAVCGLAGHIVETDCQTKSQRLTKKQYNIRFIVAPQDVPFVVDVRTASNIYERTYLGVDVPTQVYPSLRTDA